MKIQGKVALVSGSARRVGRSIALALAQRGAKIAIHCHRSDKDAALLKKEIEREYGRDTEIFQSDLADPGQVKRLAQAALQRFGSVHILVNNASVYQKTPFGRTSPEEWDSHLEVNLRAPFFLAQALGPTMKKAGEGKIINIVDWSAKRPYADYIPYCVSKAGLLCLNRALAKVLAPEVQVNAILPGPVLLPEHTASNMREAVEQSNLLKRLGSPDDVAKAVVFLVEDSDFITGAELTVDGGRLVA